MKKKLIALCLTFLSAGTLKAQTVDYSVVSVAEEAGSDLVMITTDNDYVCMPIVRRNNRGVSWLSNRIIDISTDGGNIAYLSYRGNTTNIFIKDLARQGGSVQRTNRANIQDFSYSPDGKWICFSEKRSEENHIYRTDAQSGYVCRQITSANNDYSASFSYDMKNIFFAREEKNGYSIWSYNIEDNFLSSYTAGFNPSPLKNEKAYVCSRTNNLGKGEIWKVNYVSSSEECIISDPNRSFTSPILSPNGKYILFVGSSPVKAGLDVTYWNTDIYVCHTDGTDFTQLTYHAADDLSPVWSKDGEFIYFISQRGSSNGTANIWRMTFNH